MDDIELLLKETYKHFEKNFAGVEELEEVTEESIVSEVNAEIPATPGLLYHIQKNKGVFVLRLMKSSNLRADFTNVTESPESYPSLRLINGNDVITPKFFMMDNILQAEIIADHLHNRRFPVNEELMCSISDPGFSWWLRPQDQGFQICFSTSLGLDDRCIKLGPLGDQSLAIRNFRTLEHLITSAGLSLDVTNEIGRVSFKDPGAFLSEELKDLFELGIVGEGLFGLFKMLAKRLKNHHELEGSWLYLQELASVRRFWIQVQYDLSQC